jgi:ubiquitin-protein ligase E3 A
VQVSAQHPMDLKKPLKVVFSGEEGVDEGGVRKEFFQLITAKIFDPDFGLNFFFLFFFFSSSFANS